MDNSISIHAPTRGATFCPCRNCTIFHISIHAPTRGATILRIYRASIIIDFNPRSHERSDVIDRGAYYVKIYFNPRSHERSDCDNVTALISGKISIHAPTRGATQVRRTNSRKMFISIHAPTRGATAILHKKFVYFYTIPTINI